MQLYRPVLIVGLFDVNHFRLRFWWWRRSNHLFQLAQQSALPLLVNGHIRERSWIYLERKRYALRARDR